MITMTEPSPSSTTTATRKPNLRGVSAIRAYFRRNTTPIYVVSPTPFNLLGVDRWISNFHYVNYYDSFDGTHPHVFLPRERGVDDFGSMEDLAAHGGLGTDLVVQLAWGDSGKTTFFINSRESWDRAAAEHELTGVELKVMKRINCRPLAVEAVLTRHGTLVGPLMSDITGHPELTPYKGGWAGNDVYLDVLDETQRSRARILTQNLGNRLANEGPTSGSWSVAGGCSPTCATVGPRSPRCAGSGSTGSATGCGRHRCPPRRSRSWPSPRSSDQRRPPSARSSGAGSGGASLPRNTTPRVFGPRAPSRSGGGCVGGLSSATPARCA
jgi:hypothetical protein